MRAIPYKKNINSLRCIPFFALATHIRPLPPDLPNHSLS